MVIIIRSEAAAATDDNLSWSCLDRAQNESARARASAITIDDLDADNAARC